MEKQSNLQPSTAQIIRELQTGRRRHGVTSFDFDNYSASDQEIEPLPGDDPTSVVHLDANLSRESETASSQFLAEGFDADQLGETKSEFIVSIIETPNDCLLVSASARSDSFRFQVISE
jgi:hypothetical protein